MKIIWLSQCSAITNMCFCSIGKRIQILSVSYKEQIQNVYVDYLPEKERSLEALF